MPEWYLFRADWSHRCRTLRKASAEEACLLCRATATSTKLRRSGLRRDSDVDKMPNVTKGESRESLLAMPSPSNVMEHKEMPLWHEKDKTK